MKRFAGVFLLAVVAVSGRNGSLLQQAPAQWAAKANPLAGDGRARQAGAKLYARECAACHGANGQGAKNVPPLKRPGLAHVPPGALFWVLENGSLRRGMPSFAHLPDPQRWQIVTFLKALNAPQPPDCGGFPPPP